jgi:hypothetical protein
MDIESTKAQQEFSFSAQFFLYLVTFISLGYVAFGVGNILFEFVNKLFPDLVSFNYQATFDQGVVKFALSSLFVAAPIYFILMNKISRFLLDGRINFQSQVRKLLTYIVLFFSAGTIIGDLIALMNNFLNGDIPQRFLLKVLIIFIIAGIIFGYFLWDIRRSAISEKDALINKFSFSASLLVVVSIFIFGFFIIDSPSLSRDKRIDLQVVNELQSADSAIRNYFNEGGKLPEKITDLDKTNFAFQAQKGSSLEYQKTAEDKFVLCANFVRSNENDPQENTGLSFDKEWRHSAGKACFDRIALKGENPTPINK